MKDAWTGIQPVPIKVQTRNDIPLVQKWGIVAVGADFVTVTDGTIVDVVSGVPTVQGETIRFNIEVPSSLIYYAQVGYWVHVISQGQHAWAFAINYNEVAG